MRFSDCSGRLDGSVPAASKMEVFKTMGFLFDVRSLSKTGLLLALLGTVPAIASDRIGDIEFFGYRGGAG